MSKPLKQGEKKMKKIMDVYGYYANAEDMFEKEDSFYGSVLVD